MSDFFKKIDNQFLVYPNKLGMDDEMPAFIQFKFFERKTMKSSNEIQTISLPMPTGLSKPSTISYDNVDLGFMVGSAHQNVRSGENSSLKTALASSAFNTGTYSTAWEHLAYQIAQSGTALMRSNVTKDQLMGLGEGKVANPYYTMVFKGVNLGKYEFEFIFTPNSMEEAETIHKILKSFRMHSLPHKDDVGEHFLGFPNEVEISFWWKDGKNKWIRKFKRSVIDFIDINDAPLGTTTIARDGVNLQQILKIKLTELEIVTRNDVEEGY